MNTILGLRYLASRCDGAVTEDGAGYNRMDSEFAKDLASRDSLTDGQEAAALRLLRKYRGQLSGGGFDWDELVQSYEHRTGHGIEKPSNHIAVEPNCFRVVFKYDPELVTAVKEIKGRRFDPDSKTWTAPLSSLDEVKTFAEARGFIFNEPPPEVRDIVAESNPFLTAKPQPIQTAPPNRRVTFEQKEFRFFFEYNPDLLDELKQIPDRRWDSDGRYWALPPLRAIHGEQFALQQNFKIMPEAVKAFSKYRGEAEKEQKREEERIAASKAADSSIELKQVRFPLYPFQKAGIEYLLDRKRSFLSDSMGLGKSRQALGVLEETGEYPALIVCPLTVIGAWQQEIETCLPNRSVQTLTAKNEFEKGHDLYLIHYDVVSRRSEDLLSEFKALIADECHRLKGRKTLRTRAVQAIAKSLLSKDPIILMLSGTPLVNKPSELITQLTIMRRMNDVGGFPHFWKRYCGEDQGGAFNLNELNVKLRSRCLCRRLKEEVLTELPPKTWAEVPMILTNANEYQKAEDDFIAWVRESGGNVAAAKRAEAIARLTALRHLAALGKLEGALEWIKGSLDDNGKFVVFAHHRDVQEALLEGLQDYNPRSVLGGTDSDYRKRVVKEFQEDESVQVVVCSLLAASEGITLTAASDVALLELPWTPGNLEQAVDRLHRIGQKDSVTAWQLLARGTVDSFMSSLLADKREILSQTLDGRAAAEIEKESIVDDLILRMLNP